MGGVSVRAQTVTDDGRRTTLWPSDRASFCEGKRTTFHPNISELGVFTPCFTTRSMRPEGEGPWAGGVLEGPAGTRGPHGLALCRTSMRGFAGPVPPPPSPICSTAQCG